MLKRIRFVTTSQRNLIEKGEKVAPAAFADLGGELTLKRGFTILQTRDEIPTGRREMETEDPPIGLDPCPGDEAPRHQSFQQRPEVRAFDAERRTDLGLLQSRIVEHHRQHAELDRPYVILGEDLAKSPEDSDLGTPKSVPDQERQGIEIEAGCPLDRVFEGCQAAVGVVQGN